MSAARALELIAEARDIASRGFAYSPVVSRLIAAIDALSTPPAEAIAGALNEYADLQDMVATSGGTFPVRLNGAYTSETLRRYAAMIAATEGSTNV